MHAHFFDSIDAREEATVAINLACKRKRKTGHVVLLIHTKSGSAAYGTGMRLISRLSYSTVFLVAYLLYRTKFQPPRSPYLEYNPRYKTAYLYDIGQ